MVELVERHGKKSVDVPVAEAAAMVKSRAAAQSGSDKPPR
jgi:hypothetical protein